MSDYECNIFCPCDVARFVRGEIFNMLGEEVEERCIGLTPSHKSKTRYELGVEFIHLRREQNAQRRIQPQAEADA